MARPRKTEAGTPAVSLASRSVLQSSMEVAGQVVRHVRWEMTVLGWHPARLNALMGCRHPMQAHKLKKADKTVLTLFARQAGIPAATRRRRLSVVITLGPRQREGDHDNWHKSLLDACVAAGLLVDDSPTWLEMGSLTFERGRQPATRIILEESTVESDA